MKARHAVKLFSLLLGVLLAALLSACDISMPALPTLKSKHVTVSADSYRMTVSTRAATVRDLLEELRITVGPQDRVEPDLWQETADGASVVVTRVEVREEIETHVVAFQQRVIKSEALAPGTRKMLQLGATGQEEVVYRIVSEDGVESRREELLRRILEPPIDEIIAVGMESGLPSVPISGTIAYLSGGNAWVMRDASGSRRPVTSSGDLDGRVLALSPDGNWLICSRVEANGAPDVLNSLWIVGTTVLNEEPRPLDIFGAVYVEWMPDAQSFVYSTAERIGGAPGWKAHNDLWLAELSDLKPAGQHTGAEFVTASTSPLLPAAPDELYGWWGTNFSLAPDGRSVAYGRPDGVGVVDLETKKDTRLLSFAVFHTYGDWVWLPEMSWSSDGQFIVCSSHGALAGQSPEDSPVFDVLVMDRAGKLQVVLAPEAGMWAAPAWSPPDRRVLGRHENRIAYGVARLPRDSQNSRYDLYIMDRDGSNRVQVFPPDGWEGLVAPDRAWSPDGRLLALSHEGNLYLLDPETGEWSQLTSDGSSVQPRWAG